MALAMPILIVNMGGEMVYILEQRLEAQNVPSDKGVRVLADVLRTMYSPSFVSELFKPQEVYTVKSVRQVFDRLAHSSIMRLNEASMDKLFDLMVMGFKYQLLSCRSPPEILVVTLNHLRALRGKVASDPAVAQLIAAAQEKVEQTYAPMLAGEWERQRRALCCFLQDRRVKVSIFLQSGIQRQDGTIAHSCAGALPRSVPVPGAIRLFPPAGGAPRTHSFAHPLAGQLSPFAGGEQGSSELGANLYTGEHMAPSGAETSAPVPSSTASVNQGGSKPRAPAAVADSTLAAKEILAGGHAAAAKRELNMLASLISSGAAPATPLKINLFPDAHEQDGDGAPGGRAETVTLDFQGADGAGRRRELDVLVEGIGGMAAAGEADEDDLLALMDQAG